MTVAGMDWRTEPPTITEGRWWAWVEFDTDDAPNVPGYLNGVADLVENDYGWNGRELFLGPLPSPLTKGLI